jgi:hypothetical protein
MACILNELSISPEGVYISDVGEVIEGLITTFYVAKVYKLEQLKAPTGFNDMPIGNNLSLNAYRKQIEDPDKRQRVVGFLANVVDDFNDDFTQEIKDADIERMFEVSFNDQISTGLKDAHTCLLPILSLQTSTYFSNDFLECRRYTLDDQGWHDKPVRLVNLHNVESVAIHQGFLMHTCQKIILERKNWNPYKNPSWRYDATDKIIKESKYPDFSGNESTDENRAKNTAVVIEILKANGWTYNYDITRKNSHRQEIWKIFTNDMTDDSVFISVDLSEGEFEIQDRKGKWVNTTFFDGRKNEKKDYSKANTHNIIVK